jgi:hypothetical protein
MSISVRMTQDWECPEDADRNVVRRYPNGLVLEMTDDVAAVAIALGVAEPMRPLSDVHQAMVDAAARVLAGEDVDEAELEAALAAREAPSGARADAETPSGGQGADGDTGAAGPEGEAGSGDSGGEAGSGETTAEGHQPAAQKPKSRKGK